jgi:ribosome-associated toxin RatA of RatAB toxin-antitoxin module
MAQVNKSVLLEYSAPQMFALVDRIEDYPLFMPWCSRTELKFRNAETTVGTLFIDFKAVKSHFTTSNRKSNSESMEISLVDGPFRRLDGSWRFRPLDDQACKVEFALNYEFSSRLFEKLIGPVFSHVTGSFVDAFVKRARQVYGQEVGK